MFSKGTGSGLGNWLDADAILRDQKQEEEQVLRGKLRNVVWSCRAYGAL